jgi:hypothetical protein
LVILYIVNNFPRKAVKIMFTLTLNEKEIDLLKKSINHCLQTCKDGGSKEGCSDCAAIEGVLKRLP